jgi:predicted KAP-like P-loop ATPase
MKIIKKYLWLFFLISSLILLLIPGIYSFFYDYYTDMQIMKKFWILFVLSGFSAVIGSLCIRFIE